jgi:acyl-[acyl-carrier-protein]-phospholipid O-acyltransferase/long-chain-fatty-acid--[acyl-carrier-protein] ligase
LVGAWCLAKYLKSWVGPGQNVGVWLPTGLGSAFANIALAFLRKTSVNLNYTAGGEAVRSAARQTDMKVVITAKRFVDRMPLDLPEDIQRIYLEDALAAIPGRWKLVRMLAVLLLPGWFLDRVVLRCRKFKLDDPLTVIFSSGSTGEPKGVTLTLRNISANGDSFEKGVNFTTKDRMLCTLPMFHSFGYTVCLWAPVGIGMMSVYYPDPRAAKEVGELAKRWQCSIALGTATFLRFYLRRCQPDDFKSVRLYICGAEKLPVSLAQEFQAKFGVLPFEGYGCTELSPVVSTNLPDVTHKGVTQIANKFGTVGQPIPGVAVRAWEPETQTPLPIETEGVLWCTGPNVMAGYWRQPEKTALVVRDGWYCTGDMGFVDADGFIHITGRLSRFAKIAGEMVPLEKVEEELHLELATNGERALAVAAVPDPKRGERLVVLYLKEFADKLPAAFDGLRKKGLPNLWIPDLRDCHVVEAFPALGSGKLDLRGLSDLAKKIAG